MGVFSKVFKNKDGPAKPQPGPTSPSRPIVSTNSAPTWENAWARTEVSPEEVQQLLHACTLEVKSRALEIPFMMLPFRPSGDSSAAKTFIRNFFKGSGGSSAQYSLPELYNELKLTEPLVLCSILKWCWSRLKGGVVTWNTYELFRVGEIDSNFAKNSFDTFIPLSASSSAHKNIIFDFFDLLAAIAANGKTNGLGGRKLSRLAGWWAFEHIDTGKGFNGGYKSWASAADATSHLFLAYLRSLAPDAKPGTTGISKLPRSLEALVAQTEYPPQTPEMLLSRTSKVVMIVDSVSPTPYALLRRAKNFEYRNDDRVLHQFSEYSDPIIALTPECKRVLDAIAANNSTADQVADRDASNTKMDASWSRFEDIGFSSLLDEPSVNNESGKGSYSSPTGSLGNRQSAATDRGLNLGRPTTPSWADFLSSGFADDSASKGSPSLLLPPDQILPPLSPTRVRSSQSHVKNGLREDSLEPGELASINYLDLDETFWWVWMTSLAIEEPVDRKGVFGRCAFLETTIIGGRWLIIEEQLRGATNIPDESMFVLEKRSRFSSLTKRGRTRRQSTGKQSAVPAISYQQRNATAPQSRTTFGAEQQALVQAAAAALVEQKKAEENMELIGRRRARTDENVEAKTTSVMTLGLQPVIMKEAGPAMQWARKFDKETVRQKYLGDNMAGKGEFRNSSPNASTLNVDTSLSAGDATAQAQKKQIEERGLAQPLTYEKPAPVLPPAETSITPVAIPTTTMEKLEPTVNEPPAPDLVEKTEEPTLQAPVAPVVFPKEPTVASAAPVVAPKEPTVARPVTPVAQTTPATREPPISNTATTATGRVEKPSTTVNRLDRKPVGSVDSTTRDFATGSATKKSTSTSTGTATAATTKPTNVAAIAAAGAWANTSQPSSPESAKRPSAVLQKNKKDKPRGFKGLFGKKKNEAPTISTPSQSAIAQKSMNGSAVAAQQQKVTKSPPVQRKQLSSSEQPASSTPQPAPTGATVAAQTIEPPTEAEVQPANMDDGEPGPVMTTDANDFADPAPLANPTLMQPAEPEPNVSAPAEPISSEVTKTEAADSAVPLAVPEASTSSGQFNTRAAQLLIPDSNEVQPEATTQVETHAEGIENDLDLADDEASPRQSYTTAPKQSMETPVDAATTSDRWAQIKKSAADRQMSAEQAERTRSQSQSARTEKTDDGETSGEETIESRVARIKARVAELTGSQTTAPPTSS